MRWPIFLFLLLWASGCRRAEPAPAPTVARLTVHFLDQTGELPLAIPPAEGPWAFMDAGLWRPLEVHWKPGGRQGIGVVARTSPDWVLLKDPAGDIHRIVMREADLSARPRADRLADDEREWLASLGLLWVLQWIRR